MAQFLYRLGHAAFDHRKKFIAAWVAILTLIGLLAGLFMGKLSNTFSLPGTETERVLDVMYEELPELSGGNGSIVFTTENGEPFTDEQKAAIGDTVSQLESMEEVRSVTNPFTLQNELDGAMQLIAEGKQEIADNEQKLQDARAQIADAEEQIAQGEKDLAAGEKEIEENTAKLEEGRIQLEDGKRQLADAKAQLDAAEAKLAAGEKQLAASKKQLADGQAQYEAGRAQLLAGEKQLEDGKAQLEAGKKELAAQKKAYDAGVQELTTGLGVSTIDQVPAAISAAQAQIDAGTDQATTQKTQFEAQLSDLNTRKTQMEQDGETGTPEYQDVLDGIQQVEADLQRADAGLTQLAQEQAKLDKAQAGYTQLAAAPAQFKQADKKLAQAEKTLTEKTAELEAGKKKLAASAQQLRAGQQRLAQGERELAAGTTQYQQGLAQYNAGKAELDANEAKLVAGEKALAEGRQQIIDGKEELETNKAKIEDAVKEIADGELQLEDGKEELARGERTAQLSEPIRFISESGTTAISQVLFYNQAESLTAEQRDNIKALADGPAEVGVKTLFSKEIVSDLNSIFGPGEVIGFVIAGIVLLVMLGTVVAAGLPLIVALLGVAAGVGTTLAFSSLIDMQSITPALALMLGLAVGIDYSLFIVHRHRSQLLSGMDTRESIARSIGTSGNAVVFAGLTVIIALSALLVSGLPFIGVLGVSAAFTVLMAVLLSLTFTPAVLSVLGEKILTKKGRARRAQAVAAGHGQHASITTATRHGASASMWWASSLTKRPWLSAITSVAVLVLIALPVQSLVTALPDGGSEEYGSDGQQAYEITSNEFGAGFNGPLIVLAELPVSGVEAEADDALLDVAERIAKVDGVFTAIPVATNEDLTYGALQVVPTTGPAAPETEQVVHTLRDMHDEILNATGVDTAVTGQVAAQIDVSEKITEALPPYLAIVVGLSLVLLLLVFRSVVVPVIATLGFLLSLAAAFGATVAVYQWGWFGAIFDVHAPGPIMSFLPILLTGILFGLAMDYQVFLVTAIREAYAHGGDARKAVREGFDHAAPVVVAAALIMVSVFAGFVFSHLTMIRPIGFALAVGVLFDAFIVRMTLTPAVMHLLGDKAWYLPRWLDKVLPDVDVEGASLNKSLDEHPAQETQNASV
ncbi:MMPL family transporter [Timonella sp. A28]|uniref:MMPL family transporter n=1 Tax=Timonella sp. A28 TaxID=3442640 RepID=UPI003EBF7E5B